MSRTQYTKVVYGCNFCETFFQSPFDNEQLETLLEKNGLTIEFCYNSDDYKATDVAVGVLLSEYEDVGSVGVSSNDMMKAIMKYEEKVISNRPLLEGISDLTGMPLDEVIEDINNAKVIVISSEI